MIPGLIKSGPDTAKIARGCPDTSSMDAIAKIDFADEFSFDSAVAARVKTSVIATSALKDLGKGIDADLMAGCSGLAKDLGATGTFKTGVDACKAAVKAMGDAKAKMGAVTVAVEVKPPVCSAPMALVADCDGQCDPSLKGAKADLTCEDGDISGSCAGVPPVFNSQVPEHRPEHVPCAADSHLPTHLAAHGPLTVFLSHLPSHIPPHVPEKSASHSP